MKFRRAQENASFKKILREEIEELIQQEASSEEIVDQCKDRMKTTSLTDVDIAVMVSYNLDCWYMSVVGMLLTLFICCSCGDV